MSKRRPRQATATEQPCGRCGQPVQAAFVCRDCCDRLHGWISEVPELARQLDIELTKQGRKTSGPSVRTVGREQPLPYVEAASKALAELRSVLVSAVRVLSLGDRDAMPEDDTIAAMCAWLARHEAAVPLRAEGPDIVVEVERIVAKGWRVVGTPPEKVFIGMCVCSDANGKRTRLYARMGEALHWCKCGQAWDVDERATQLQAEMADYLVTWQEVYATLKIPRGTVHNWVSRRQLEQRSTNVAGEPLYRYGDALALNAQRSRKAG